MWRLQGSWSTNFPCLFELGIDSCHHAQARDVGKSWKHLCNSLSLHFEPFQTPVARTYRIFESSRYSGVTDASQGVKRNSWSALSRSLSLQIAVNLFLEVELEQLELILKEERNKLASKFESLISVVIFVVQFAGVHWSLNNSANHEGHISTLCVEWHVFWQRNVGKNDVL